MVILMSRTTRWIWVRSTNREKNVWWIMFGSNIEGDEVDASGKEKGKEAGEERKTSGRGEAPAAVAGWSRHEILMVMVGIVPPWSPVEVIETNLIVAWSWYLRLSWRELQPLDFFMSQCRWLDCQGMLKTYSFSVILGEFCEGSMFFSPAVSFKTENHCRSQKSPCVDLSTRDESIFAAIGVW